VNYVPTDLYFACLDGSWNESHDHIWGQAGVDNVDLYAELYVGRLPTSTVADATVLIDKVITYESAVDRDYSDKVLLLAEVLFPADWHEGDPIILNGAELSESLYVEALSGKPLELTRAYESYKLFSGAVPLSKQATIDSMNAGPGMVNHIGHGYRFNISCGDASLLYDDADQLTNGERLFVLFMVDCFVSAFDYACLSENFLKNPNGGAVATIGSSHIEFPVIDAYYMEDYYQLLFDDRVVRIGEAFAKSRLDQTPWAEMDDNVDRWTHYILALLADPEMPVWTGSVDSAVVSHVSSVGLGPNSILVEVSAGGQPVDSATVCLYKANEDYQYDTTDALGEVVVDFAAESPGSISVVVTAHNVARDESFITVNPSTPAYVHYAGAAIDDDSTGGSYGNGDGVVDAGETVDLLLTLVNTGGSASGDVSFDIACDHAQVTIVDTTAVVGVLGPDSTVTAQSAVRIALDAGVPDQSAVEFDLSITDDASGNWTDAFVEVVRAPDLDLVSLGIDDGPPLGNGNGVNEPGEEFLLFYEIKNYGTGAASGLAAHLADVDDAFVFFDSTDVYPDLVPFTGAKNAAGFRIAEPDTTSENRLAVEVVDLFGRSYQDTIELRPPDPPANLFFDASHGVDRIEVAWSPSASPDVSRYQVYHSLVSGGPYELATTDPVEHSVFMDVGLSPSTRYHYVVTSIDSSGNESAYSAEVSASTNPPQVAGWPNPMMSSSPSSPAVGDIDGDGDKEIVVGNRYVYAWHHDGIELRDGDEDPQTWGILNTEGTDFAAAIALARLDGSPGLDVMAADLGTNSVFCMTSDGDMLPGWPQVGENDYRAAPVAGDLDGDGVFEVIAVDAAGVVYAWNLDGSEVIDGDSDPMTAGVFFRTPTSIAHYHTPALCDLDDDGKDEIVLGTRTGEIFALNGDGSDVPGWPFALPGEAVGSVAVGDVDDDGALEVVCHTRSTHLYLLNHDASVATGWPRMISINQPYFCPSPALADFDGDGKLEVVVVGYVSSATELYVIKADGQFYPGWPVQFNTSVATECSPTVADIDGDGSLDIVIGDESRYVYAYDIDGNMIDGFPVATGDAVRATPFLDDLDEDGDIDMVLAGWDGNLYVWDLTGIHDPVKTPWPTFRANVHRNGESEFVVPTGVGKISFRFEVVRGAVELVWVVPPMASTRFDVYRWDAGTEERGNRVQVAAGVRPGAGRALRVVVTDLEPGRHYVFELVPAGAADALHESRPVYVPVSVPKLAQNYPNPFGSSTTISFYVTDGGPKKVSLRVYDVSGALVTTLVDDTFPPGRHDIEWSGRDTRGNRVGTGLYFYQYRHRDVVSTRKLLLIR
jgi:hypothetical protein